MDRRPTPRTKILTLPDWPRPGARGRAGLLALLVAALLLLLLLAGGSPRWPVADAQPVATATATTTRPGPWQPTPSAPISPSRP